MTDRPWVKEYDRYLGKLNLNLGCALNPVLAANGRTWVNLDMNADVGCDVVHDLNVLPLPFEEGHFDAVWGSHVFEHIAKERFLPLVADLHRIIRPQGYLVAITPYGTATSAWDNPHHVQQFSEMTWRYCTRSLYEAPHYGHGATQNQPVRDWHVEQIVLVPDPEFLGDPEIDKKRKLYNNVIAEVHCVMQRI